MKILIFLRVKDYLKNLIIFFPLFFSGELFDYYKFKHTFIAFVAFSIFTSFFYVLNDYIDREEDEKDPKKEKLVQAEKDISYLLKIIIFCFIAIISILYLSSFHKLIYCFIAYGAISSLYSLYFKKRFPLFSIFWLSTVYWVRLYIGRISSGILVTPYMYLFVFLIALFFISWKIREKTVLLRKIFLIIILVLYMVYCVTDGYDKFGIYALLSIILFTILFVDFYKVKDDVRLLEYFLRPKTIIIITIYFALFFYKIYWPIMIYIK